MEEILRSHFLFSFGLACSFSLGNDVGCYEIRLHFKYPLQRYGVEHFGSWFYYNNVTI